MKRFASFIAVLVCLSNTQSVDAQSGHDLYHQYYKHWYNQVGTHCCDEEHCRPGEFRWLPDKGWQVKVLDKWRDIYSNRHVVDDGGLGPFGSVCHTKTGHIFCVDLPDGQF